MGTKARGGITLYNVKNGKDAEYHRLRPQSEKAVVGGDNSLYITLSYIIEHINGAQVTTEAGSAQGYHVTARMNNGVSIAMTNGAVNSGTYKLTDYSKAQNRPDYVIIELRDSADKVVDIRTAQIIMEASSYVDIVADLRTTVSQHGDSISTIKQTANSVSATITSLKNGLETVGMHLDGENSTFDIVADTFKVTTTTGKVPFFTSGGKLNTDFIDAKAIVAKGIKAQTIDAEGATFTNVTVTGSINATEGRIAGFRIAGDGLINENEKGKFTNDAYVIFRNDPHSTFAGIGGNVLPASSGARAVARFENNDKTDQWGLGSNYAMILSAKNAEHNFAMVGQGHCSIRGNMEGYLAQKITLAEGSVTEIDYNKGAKVLFENSLGRSGLYLPRLSTLRNSIDAGADESFAVFIHIVQVGGTTSGDVLYGRNADVFRVVKAEETAGGRQITNQDGTKSTLTLQADGRIKNTTISSAGTAVTTMHNSGTEFRDYWMNSYSFPQIYNNDMNNVKVIAMGQGDAVTLLLSYDGNSYNAYIWSTNNRFI